MVESAPKILLYWHTLRHLKPVQWRYRLKNAVQSQYHRWFPVRVRRELLRRIPQRIVLRVGGKRVAWFEKTHDGAHGMFWADDILKGCFTFLNRSKQFDGPVRWVNPEFSYLWDFNLHYFEYLESLASREDSLSKGVIRSLLDGWIDSNPCPVQPAWHPYPISLRTINWVKLCVNRPEFADEKVLRSLYSQFLFLERNIEGHLQVNHLLENGRALVFGGLFFEGQDARRWFDRGLRLLKQEVREEYLPNGGHFELSPMYHCILLEALFDTYAYLTSMGHDVRWLFGPLRKMCEWLENIRCPDGTFPLFNDAAIGISAAPDEILSNAERLLSFGRKTQLDATRDCDKFFVFDAKPFFCAVDGAPIGPSYNPGHAHSDNFTYELFLRGERLVVDAGTFSYDVNPERIASRSTTEHNTVVINGLEQSEAWGGFRMARRSNPTLSRAGRYGRYLAFQGKYANRVDPGQGITHERIIILKPSRWMLVWDTIEARGAIEAESLCRFAPEWTMQPVTGSYSLQRSGKETVRLYPIQVTGSSIRESRYAPEFGKSLPVQQLSLLATGEKHVETGYLFTVEAIAFGAELHVERKADDIYIYLNGAKERVNMRELEP
jgi:uncharacterized heparinase superfamily protein